jgi:hypothetical protein
MAMKLLHLDSGVLGAASVNRQLFAAAADPAQQSPELRAALTESAEVLQELLDAGAASPLAAWDHQEANLKTLFGFLGVTDIGLKRAEGVNVRLEQKEKTISEAKGSVTHLVAAQAPAQAAGLG